MSKENNLTDFLTDVADAIREKKGTDEKINPQNFSDEIKGIKTSSSMWTGHVDVEGLKAIGWDDEDIAYFQEHGVNWMEEDDEYYKVSDDNKALYGVLTWENLLQYKDRIVYLPKIDFYNNYNFDNRFKGCTNMRAMPLLKNGIIYSDNMFKGCSSLLYLPPLNLHKSEGGVSFAESVVLLRYTPTVNFINARNLMYCFNGCRFLNYVDINTSPLLQKASYLFYSCTSLELITGELDVSNVSDFSLFIYGDIKLLTIVPQLDFSLATKVSSFAYNCTSLRDIKIKKLPISIAFSQSTQLSKESLLFMINNEAATESITITLHATAYARLSTDPDIVEALSNHPLVSLASA